MKGLWRGTSTSGIRSAHTSSLEHQVQILVWAIFSFSKVNECGAIRFTEVLSSTEAHTIFKQFFVA